MQRHSGIDGRASDAGPELELQEDTAGEHLMFAPPDVRLGPQAGQEPL